MRKNNYSLSKLLHKIHDAFNVQIVSLKFTFHLVLCDELPLIIIVLGQRCRTLYCMFMLVQWVLTKRIIIIDDYISRGCWHEKDLR